MVQLNPSLIEINFKSTSSFFRKNSEVATKIKEKFKFKELKIKEDRIFFRDGTNYPSCTISENDVSIVALNKISGISVVNLIMEFLNEINFPISESGNCIESLEVTSFLTFDKDDDVVKFFLGNSFDNLKKIDNVVLRFDFTDTINQKDLQLSARLHDSISWCSITMLNHQIFINSDELISSINKTISYLSEKVNNYINSQGINIPDAIAGEINNE